MSDTDWWRGQEEERGFLLWKARRVADQAGGSAVSVMSARRGEGDERGEAVAAMMEYVVHHLKGDLFPDLMDLLR
jgi:hypothetical protein